MNEVLADISIELISHAGEARSTYMQALAAAKDRDFKQAEEKCREADQELAAARGLHMDILSKCANEQIGSDILLIHAQDHLTLADLTKCLAEEIIALREELAVK